jgi:hypothetical protein
MKIYYANDTLFHAGSVAVTESLVRRLTDQGHTVIGRCLRPDGPDAQGLRACDALVVNGEGTFRDETRAWEPGRIQRLMLGMRDAKALGKRVHFINATWCNMLPGWGDILASLDEVAVRETLSAAEMERVQGVRPKVYLDASYYAPVLPYAIGSFKDRVVVGKLYPHNFRDALTEAHRCFDQWPDRLPILDPGRGATWAEIIRAVTGARLYITGQHHGVYAACVARVPFVYCKCNTHKVEGLFDWAGVDIPTVRNAADVPICVEWALDHPEVYRQLFEFMATRPQWPGIVA